MQQRVQWFSLPYSWIKIRCMRTMSGDWDITASPSQHVKVTTTPDNNIQVDVIKQVGHSFTLKVYAKDDEMVRSEEYVELMVNTADPIPPDYTENDPDHRCQRSEAESGWHISQTS